MEKDKQTLNLEYLDEIAAGDINFKKDLIKIFLQQVPEFISNMKKFHKEKDFENLAKEAHTAKSSVLIFGMEKSGEELKKIQTLAEKNNTDQIPELLNSVIVALDKIIAPLNKIVES